MTPVVLIAPRFIEGYVREVSMVTGVPLHYQYYHNKEIMTTDHSLKSFFANEMDLTLVRNVPVIHATDSWGLLVEHQRGWRILFSGDTRPTRSLMDLVGDNQCDLVIYEATMKDKDRELAIKKNHSTTSEALFMASKLNPYRVLLTHFSQRQSIIPVVDFVYPEPLPHVDIRTIKTDEKTSSFKNLDMHNITHLSEEEIIDIGERVSEDKVSIAFDLMSIHLSNLQTIPLTLPMFKYLYKELKNLLGKDIEQ
jgi:ribonuclease BN (tRNA processing enzyme)